MQTKCICKYCGGDFETFPSLIKKGGGKFCCPEHYHAWISENKTKSGKNSNLWNDAKVEVICKYCGKSKLTYKSQIKWRGSNFCNRSCQGKWASENKTGTKSPLWVDKVKCVCEICGTVFEKQRSDIKRQKGKFCNQNCFGISMKGKANPLWNNGSSFEPYCPKWTARFRKNVRDFFNNTCVECGKTKEENITNMVVHHVNYNKQVCCEGDDVKDRKFVTLCRSCHGKTIPEDKREYYQIKFTNLINEKYNGLCYNPPNIPKSL